MNRDKRQADHEIVIKAFLAGINKGVSESAPGDFVLKGGTALMLCYGLDRFSEDIDLDSVNVEIEAVVARFCRENEYSYRCAKNTDITKRFFIHYKEDARPLKVETSYRRKTTPDLKIVNGITVYSIEQLAILKAAAYNGRDKIRDLYDLTFICENFWNDLSAATKQNIETVVGYKGIEQFGYLLQTQHDEYIDKNILAENYLKMFDRLGLLVSDSEKSIFTGEGDIAAKIGLVRSPEYDPHLKETHSAKSETIDDDLDR